MGSSPVRALSGRRADGRLGDRLCIRFAGEMLFFGGRRPGGRKGSIRSKCWRFD